MVTMVRPNMSTRPAVCHTAAEVVDALGGPTGFARWWWGEGFEKLHVQRAWAWGKRGFPRELHLVMSGRLFAEKNIQALPSAWKIQALQAAE
jgi:hypothetical protein